jgi:hypothetical protein
MFVVLVSAVGSSLRARSAGQPGAAVAFRPCVQGDVPVQDDFGSGQLQCCSASRSVGTLPIWSWTDWMPGGGAGRRSHRRSDYRSGRVVRSEAVGLVAVDRLLAPLAVLLGHVLGRDGLAIVLAATVVGSLGCHGRNPPCGSGVCQLELRSACPRS